MRNSRSFIPEVSESAFNYGITPVQADAFDRFEREGPTDVVALVRGFLRNPEGHTRDQVSYLVRHFESTGSPLSEAIRDRLPRCKDSARRS